MHIVVALGNGNMQVLLAREQISLGSVTHLRPRTYRRLSWRYLFRHTLATAEWEIWHWPWRSSTICSNRQGWNEHIPLHCSARMLSAKAPQSASHQLGRGRESTSDVVLPWSLVPQVSAKTARDAPCEAGLLTSAAVGSKMKITPVVIQADLDFYF